MTTREQKLLWDIQDAAHSIITFVFDRDLGDFRADAMLRAAVERKFDVIGEAARRLRDVAPETFARFPSLRGAIAFRNFLTHVYDQVDPEKVWAIIETDVQPLLNALDGAMPTMAIQWNWAHRESFEINGVTFADGRVFLIGVASRWDATLGIEQTLVPSGWTTVGEVLASSIEANPIGRSDLIERCRTPVSETDLTVIGGECPGHGSIGFIAVTQQSMRQLRWIAWFDRSNPFSALDVEGGVVMATTTLGTRWRIPLSEPDRLTIIN